MEKLEGTCGANLGWGRAEKGEKEKKEKKPYFTFGEALHRIYTWGYPPVRALDPRVAPLGMPLDCRAWHSPTVIASARVPRAKIWSSNGISHTAYWKIPIFLVLNLPFRS